MAAAADTDLQLRALEETVAAMRAALERQEREAAARLQAALAAAAGEADQLRSTIVALRERLEAVQEAGLAAVQEERSRAADECRQLQATVQALRAQLDAGSRP